MKVLLLTNSLKIYSEVWLQRHLSMLKEHLCAVVCLESNASRLFGNIPVINLNLAKKGTYRITSKFFPIPRDTLIRYADKALTKTLIKYKPDVVVVEYLTNAVRFRNVFECSGIPLVVHCHGYDVTWSFSNHNTPEKPYFESDYKSKAQSLSTFATIIANSRYTYNHLVRSGFKEENLVIKYLGVEPLGGHTLTRKTDEFKILYVGRLVDCKGPDLLIQAFDLASAHGMNAKLYIAGEGPLLVTCQLLKARSPYSRSIRFLGRTSTEETRQLLADSHVYSAHNCTGPLSHQTEALGVSILEAMSFELPVVTGQSGGINESVIHGQTGFLHEPGDVRQHAQNLLKLYSNREFCQELGQQGRERVEAYFAFEKEKTEFEQILSLRIR